MEQHYSETRDTRRRRGRRAGANFAQTLVAHLYGVTLEDLLSATRRCAKTAFARHLAMYLMHTVYGMSMTEIGQAFGRDRTTASHGCHRVEDMRENPSLEIGRAHV